MRNDLSRPKRRSSIGEKLAVGGIVAALVIVFLALTIGVLIAGVLILVFAIIDLVNVGPNFWNVFWIVIGGMIVLSSVFGAARSSSS